MGFEFSYTRPKQSTATNWVADTVERRTKEWPVKLGTSGVMPETPGEKCIHLRFTRGTGREDEDEREITERLTVVLSLEDMIHMHRAVEDLLLAPLACDHLRDGKRCRGVGVGGLSCPAPLIANCKMCEDRVRAYESRWNHFKAWETEQLEARKKARSE